MQKNITKVLNNLRDILYKNSNEIIYNEKLYVNFNNTMLHIELDEKFFIIEFIKDNKSYYKLKHLKDDITISGIIESYEIWFEDTYDRMKKLFL